MITQGVQKAGEDRWVRVPRCSSEAILIYPAHGRSWCPAERKSARFSHDALPLKTSRKHSSNVLEKNYFGDADAQRGKFRTFLLTAVGHFLANEWHNVQPQKRGGGCAFVSLDDASAEERYRLESADSTPEKLFDRQWAETVLDAVLAQLRDEFGPDGNATRFGMLNGFLIAGQGITSYAQIAAQLGVNEVSARSAVSRLRQRFRELMRNQIANTVSHPDDVDEEIRYLFEALAS